MWHGDCHYSRRQYKLFHRVLGWFSALRYRFTCEQVVRRAVYDEHNRPAL